MFAITIFFFSVANTLLCFDFGIEHTKLQCLLYPTFIKTCQASIIHLVSVSVLSAICTLYLKEQS